jgi:AcrR family transcriptional regulator
MNTETHLLGKRESSKIQIRERLLDESLKLFSSRGLEKTTVADIVEQSGIARGTFYNYFPDVNSLFDAIISQMNGNIQTEIKANREKSLSVYVYLQPLNAILIL